MAASTAGITALGAATLGIGAAVGAGLALWAAHEARVRGATNENEALGVIMPDFNAAIQAEFQNLNAGQITPNTAYNDLETIRHPQKKYLRLVLSDCAAAQKSNQSQ